MDNGDIVETESGVVRINGREINIVPDKPVLSPSECKYLQL